MRLRDVDGVRVRLNSEGLDLFWERVDDSGGMRALAERNGFKPSQVYSWKARDTFIPYGPVQNLLEDPMKHVEAYKGCGRSKPVKDPVLPIPESNELLTRVQASVTVNRNGVPVYQTGDRGLLQRFKSLLQKLGEVPISVYSRDVYELRYPKFLHGIFDKMNFQPDLDALVDEKASIDGEITLEGRRIDPGDINDLHHREKRMKLALLKQDRAEIARLMKQEKERVEKALNRS